MTLQIKPTTNANSSTYPWHHMTSQARADGADGSSDCHSGGGGTNSVRCTGKHCKWGSSCSQFGRMPPCGLRMS